MTGSDAPSPNKKRSLAWLGLGLLVVPGLLGVTTLLVQEPLASSPRPQPLDEKTALTKESGDSQIRFAEHLETAPGSPPRREARAPGPAEFNDGHVHQEDDWTDEEADEDDWDGRMERFDENAQWFDERVALFEDEKARGLMDEISRNRLRSSLAQDLGRLSPQTRADVECTQSICEIELTGPSTVGSMIADLAPFLRKHPTGASGQPRGGADPERSFRLLFQTDKLPTSTPVTFP